MASRPHPWGTMLVYACAVNTRDDALLQRLVGRTIRSATWIVGEGYTKPDDWIVIETDDGSRFTFGADSLGDYANVTFAEGDTPASCY